MSIVLTCCAIAVLLSYLYSRGKNEYGLIVGFIIVTVIQAIRFDYGTDMLAYEKLYKTITSSDLSFESAFNNTIYKEPGWVILNFLFKNFGGFYAMTAAISIFENVVVYRFIKNNVERKCQFFAVFIYLFTFSFYLLNMSMLRQGLAIAIGLLVLELMGNNKIWQAFFWVAVASLIHTSALVLVILLLINIISKFSSKILALIILAIFISLWGLSNLLPTITMFLLESDTFEQYQFYYRDIHGHMGIGFLLLSIPSFAELFVLFFCSLELKEKRIVVLSTIGFMLTPFGTTINMVSRIIFYFGIFSIASLPIITKYLTNRVVKYFVLTIFIGSMLSSLSNNINSESFRIPYSEYQTIFSNWNQIVNW